MHKAKRKPTIKKLPAAPLDRYDPRVKALAKDLLREVMEKEQLRIAAESQQTERAEKDASEKFAAAAEMEAKAKRKMLPVERRLDLARRASCEMEALERLMREQVAQMVGCDTLDKEVAISMCLSRMKMLAEVLWDIATPEDEHDQDAAALEGFFTYFPETAEA